MAVTLHLENRLRRAPTFADRLAKSANARSDGQLAPWFARALDGWLGSYIRTWYRPSFEGLEQLDQPTTAGTPRSFLVVSNHSGGGLVEVVALTWLWRRPFGDRRPIVGMAHPFIFHVPILGSLIRGLGAIPSTYEDALAALRSGIPVLVFPGGDREAFRPVWQPLVLDFQRRKGFLRLAAEAEVPILPIGIRGSHWTMPILWPSRVLPWLLVVPRLLGVKVLPITVFGAVGAVLAFVFLRPALAAPCALAWMFGPLQALFMVPVRIRVCAGAPIAPEELFPDSAPDAETALANAYDRVEGSVRALVAR